MLGRVGVSWGKEGKFSKQYSSKENGSFGCWFERLVGALKL